jgi:transcriptional regulator with XRE-family HTH domain
VTQQGVVVSVDIPTLPREKLESVADLAVNNPKLATYMYNENIHLDYTKYFAYTSSQRIKGMSDVLVCAEPETREEATRFVSNLGAHPQICSVNSLKRWREKGEKAKVIFVYLKGGEPRATLRTCLRQILHDRGLDVVVYSHPTSDHQAAELGKIVGELRPHRTYMCFADEEVEQFFQDHTGFALPGKRNSRETLGTLRKDLDLTQVDVAAALDVTPRTVQNWESRGGASARQYRDLKELRGLLSKYIESDQVATWMDSPNEAFQKRTPRELIREGKTRDLIFEFGRLQTGEPL